MAGWPRKSGFQPAWAVDFATLWAIMRRKQQRKQFGWGCFLLACVACLAVGFGVGYFAQSPAGKQWLDKTAEEASAAATWVTDFVDGLATTPERSAVVGTGQIEVYFAPVSPSHPFGIDDALVAHIAGAQETVHAAFYDLGLMMVAEALIERHRAGVEVALVTDSDYAKRPAFQACVDAGIPVRLDARSSFMHNKFCIVDNEVVWTGSANVTENGMYRNDNNALIIHSPHLAHNYATEFLEMFQGHFGPQSPANTPYPLLEVGGILIETYFAPEDGVEEQIIRTISETEEHLGFMAFSFTSQAVAEAMVARMGAGVRVRGVFEARNAGSRYSRDEFLAEAGADIRLDGNPNSMHHKVMLMDGARVLTGSYNFSNNANTRNDENVLIIHDPALAQAYESEFERVWAEAR